MLFITVINLLNIIVYGVLIAFSALTLPNENPNILLQLSLSVSVIKKKNPYDLN